MKKEVDVRKIRAVVSLFLIGALCLGVFIHQGWGIAFALLVLTCIASLSSYRLFSRRRKGLYFVFNIIEFIAAVGCGVSLVLFVRYFYFRPTSDYRYDLSDIYVPAFFVFVGVLIFLIAVAEMLNVLDKREEEESGGLPLPLCVAFFLSGVAAALGMVRAINAPLFLVSFFVNSLTLGFAFAKVGKGKLFFALLLQAALLGAMAMVMTWSFIIPMGTNDHYVYSGGIDRGGGLFTASLILGIGLIAFDLSMAIVCLVLARKGRGNGEQGKPE